MITHRAQFVDQTPTPELISVDKPPTVVMAYGAQLSTADGIVHSDPGAGFGFSNEEPQEIAVASGGAEDHGLDRGGSAIQDANFTVLQTAPNLSDRQLVMERSCGPNGFEWAKDVPPYNGQLMSFLALVGGANFQAHVGTFSSPTAAEGAISRVVTGVGFEPQIVVFLWQKSDGITPNDPRWGGPGYGMGACSDVTDPGQSWAFQDNNDYLVLVSGVTNVQKEGVSFVAMGDDPVPCLGLVTSFDADGFTVEFNHADVRSANGFSYAVNGRLVGYLAMRDDLGGFRVGNGFQPGTGLQSFTGLGFDPQAVLLAHANCDSLDVMYTAMSVWHVGAFDADSSTSMLNGSLFGRRLAPSSISFANYGASVVAEADGQLDPGGFSLDWTLSDSVARPFGWVAMATEGTPEDCPDFQQIYRLLKTPVA